MGKILTNSCDTCECCTQLMFYSYGDPKYGNRNCSAVPCGGGECDYPPCCCGASISGNIYSNPCNQKCFDLLSPKALIYAGSAIDNIGSVGGINFTATECQLAFLSQDTTVIPNVDSKNRLYLSFSAKNDSTCGPYGLYAIYIKWYFN